MFAIFIHVFAYSCMHVYVYFSIGNNDMSEVIKLSIESFNLSISISILKYIKIIFGNFKEAAEL
jgi:hypothetical protein